MSPDCSSDTPKESSAESVPTIEVTESPQETSETIENTDSETPDSQTVLKGLSSLPGMNDKDTAELFGGSEENWRWTSNGMAASINRMKDIRTICLQPAVGELK